MLSCSWWGAQSDLGLPIASEQNLVVITLAGTCKRVCLLLRVPFLGLVWKTQQETAILGVQSKQKHPKGKGFG